MEGRGCDLQIRVAGGLGTGPTELSAFDDALDKIGIANFNLVTLSSIIPTGASVSVGRVAEATAAAQIGDRLYVVLSECRANLPGTEVWSGLGWTRSPKTGHGVFVEHCGTSRKQVETLIDESLTSMEARRRNVSFGSHEMLIVGGTCESLPTCAAVAAVFGYVPWGHKEPRH